MQSTSQGSIILHSAGVGLVAPIRRLDQGIVVTTQIVMDAMDRTLFDQGRGLIISPQLHMLLYQSLITYRTLHTTNNDNSSIEAR